MLSNDFCNTQGDNFASDVESDVDVEYVPPPVILEDELDYDEYDPEEVVSSFSLYLLINYDKDNLEGKNFIAIDLPTQRPPNPTSSYLRGPSIKKIFLVKSCGSGDT